MKRFNYLNFFIIVIDLLGDCSKNSGSYMKIEEGLDTGPFFNQIKVKIDENTTSYDLNNILAKLGAENILECINNIEKNKVS